MFTYLNVLSKLIAGHFLYLTGSKSNAKLYYASWCLFAKHTFRLPESSKKDPLIVVRVYINTIQSILKKPEIHELESNSHLAVLDTSFGAQQKRVDYLHFFKVDPRLFLSNEHLRGSSDVLDSLSHLLFITLGFVLILPFSLSKHRVNYALLLQEIPDLVNLLKLLKRQGIERLYQFCIYEKDTNFTAYILDKYGIKVSKITSEVPITFTNKIIIAYEIILCSAYQKEEVEAYKDTLFYKTIDIWVPEMQITYLGNYQNKDLELPQNTIGFYSSAFWLRKILNHSKADVGSYDAEEQLLLFTKEYLEKNPDIKMVLFTHPYEKKTDEQYQNTVHYYKTLLGEQLMKRVTLTDRNSNSTLSFHTINLGVSLFSTIIFERLGIGFKSLLAPIDKKDFPLENSPFRRICAYSKMEYFEKLDKNIPLSQTEFFKQNQIEHYISPYIKMHCELK
jgi:hypothetical protein